VLVVFFFLCVFFFCFVFYLCVGPFFLFVGMRRLFSISPTLLDKLDAGPLHFADGCFYTSRIALFRATRASSRENESRLTVAYTREYPARPLWCWSLSVIRSQTVHLEVRASLECT